MASSRTQKAHNAFNKILTSVVKELKGGTHQGFYEESQPSLRDIIILNEKHKFLTHNSQQGISRRGPLPLNRKRYAEIYKNVEEEFENAHMEREYELMQKLKKTKSVNVKKRLNQLLEEARSTGNYMSRFGNFEQATKLYRDEKQPIKNNEIIYDERAFIQGYMENARAAKLVDILNGQSHIVAWSTRHGKEVDEQGNFVVPKEYIVEIPVNSEPALSDGSYSKLQSKPLVDRLKLTNKPFLFYEELDTSHPFYEHYSIVNIIDTRWGYDVTKHKDGLFRIVLDAIAEVK